VKTRHAIPAAILCICLLTPLSAFGAEAPAAEPGGQPAAQVSQYNLGDQTLSINAGVFLPLFLLPTGTPLLGGGHLTVGAAGSLCWAAYVTPDIRLGAEVGGSWCADVNGNALFMLPLVAKASYVFAFYPFEVPVSIAVGPNLIKYGNLYNLDLLVKPGVSAYWTYNSSWSFGVNANYWFDMQFDTTSSANSRQGSFLEVSLSALYHY
jgi:hypothetical protein